ncbi:MAG: hypothetical protein JNJ45_12340 [Chthonomonas sp.]|nr:hypothetical protein [Chthonomonas sp.]
MESKDARNTVKNLPWIALAGAAAIAGFVMVYRHRNSVPRLIDDLVDLAESSMHKLEDQCGEKWTAAS